jgi:hypothetical protein
LVIVPDGSEITYYPAKESRKMWNRAKRAFSKVPRIPNQGLGSLRTMLNIPNTPPITAGATKSKRLNILSTVNESPAIEDSNRVMRTRNNIANRKKSIDFAPKLHFIEFSNTG